MTKQSLFGLMAAVVLSMFAVGCGPKGDTGPAGPPGGGRIKASIYCHGTVSGLGGGAAVLNGLDVEYNAVLTSAGDVYATASIIDEVQQVSGSAFYAAAEAGSANAQVAITSDYVGIPNGGFWTVSLNRTALVTSILYDDPSLPSVVSLNFTASSCTVGSF